MRLFGLVGYPLSHSFSVKYFTEKFEREGIRDVSYRNFPLLSLEGLLELFQEYPALCGLNVTIPYKEKVLAWLDWISPEALSIGAVNTIRVSRREGKIRLEGFNTDAPGFRKSLLEQGISHFPKALVLGSGGASRAVRHVLEQLGTEAHLVSRQAGEGVYATYSQLSAEDIRAHALIVNTTPLGMFPLVETCPDILYECLDTRHLLFDLVYNPPATLFLQRGAERGCRVKNGYDMLVYQAEESWKIFGKDS